MQSLSQQQLTSHWFGFRSHQQNKRLSLDRVSSEVVGVVAGVAAVVVVVVVVVLGVVVARDVVVQSSNINVNKLVTTAIFLHLFTFATNRKY